MSWFPYDFDRRYIAVWWPLGARAGRDGVRLTDDGRFVATYGRFRVDTPISNITGASSTGPYRAIKAVGLRLSAADSGLTMGTTPRSGVCVKFAEKVPRVIGLKDHRGLTVTVADPAGLLAALALPEAD